MRSKKMVLMGMLLMLVIGAAGAAYSHCQIPCGIYDDPVRFSLLKEHIRTIEKAMNEIKRLSSQEDKNVNQIIRWVVNKDEHAQQFNEIVTYYFMAQRISPVEDESSDEYEDYMKKLVCTHKMIFYAMKCKQTLDLENVEKLRELVDEFHGLYFGEGMKDKEKSEHEHNH